MNDYAVAKILLNTLIYKCGNFTSKNDFDVFEEVHSNGMSCGGFLCSGIMCNASMKVTSALGLYSLTYILTYIAQDPGCVIVTALEQIPDWSSYLDRQQVFVKISRIKIRYVRIKNNIYQSNINIFI